MTVTKRGVDKLVGTNGNEIDIENKNLEAGFQMGGVDIATTANIITSFVLGDAPTGVTVGSDKFVYLDDGDGDVKEALSTDITADEQVYFTVSGSLANGFPVSVVTGSGYQVFGLSWETGQTPTVGKNFYLSASEAGNVTHDAPDDGILLGELIDDFGNGTFVVNFTPNIGKHAIGEDQLRDEAVTEAKLSTAVQTKLNAGANNVESYKHEIDHADATDSSIEVIAAANLATGDDIRTISWVVTEAFAGGSGASLVLKTAAGVTIETIDLTSTLDERQDSSEIFVMTQSEAVQLDWDQGTSYTAGKVTVRVERNSY